MAASSAFVCEVAGLLATRNPHRADNTPRTVKISETSIIRSISRSRRRSISSDSTSRRLQIGRMAKDVLSLASLVNGMIFPFLKCFQEIVQISR